MVLIRPKNVPKAILPKWGTLFICKFTRLLSLIIVKNDIVDEFCMKMTNNRRQLSFFEDFCLHHTKRLHNRYQFPIYTFI